MHLMGGGDVGGAKTHIMSLVGALSRRHEVRLISFREGDFARQAGERGIDVRVIAGNRQGRSLRRLLEEIDEMQPEVIHCHGGRANLMGALARLRRDIPVVSTIHSDYRLDYLGNPVKQWTLGTANALALRRLDYYQPVADRMAQLLIRRGFSPPAAVSHLQWHGDGPAPFPRTLTGRPTAGRNGRWKSRRRMCCAASPRG